LDLNSLKQGVGLLPRFVINAGSGSGFLRLNAGKSRSLETRV
jgi:hypothetical protein